MLDELAEGLARDVHAGEHLKSRVAPARQPVVKNADVGIPRRKQNAGGALSQAVAFVAQHDAGVAPRHQAPEFELQAAQWNRTREQQMSARKDQLFPHIDERELPAIGEHAVERLRGDQLELHVACCGATRFIFPLARSKLTR